VRLLEEEARRGRRGGAEKDGLRLMPAALYAGLPAAAQLAALEPPPRGYRKVGAGRQPQSVSSALLSACLLGRQTAFTERVRFNQCLPSPACRSDLHAYVEACWRSCLWACVRLHVRPHAKACAQRRRARRNLRQSKRR
jgi:hypothetical protein